MPSLIGTSVAANYGRMTPQQTYGVGAIYSNFGTRQLRLIKVVATAADGTTAVDFTDSTYGDNVNGTISDFSKAVRALQTCAEIYQIFTPGTSGFLALVSEDTINDQSSANTADRTTTTGYAVAEKAIKDSLAKGGSATATISLMDVNSTGVVLAAQS
jgi:hypothetical protein